MIFHITYITKMLHLAIDLMVVLPKFYRGFKTSSTYTIHSLAVYHGTSVKDLESTKFDMKGQAVSMEKDSQVTPLIEDLVSIQQKLDKT